MFDQSIRLPTKRKWPRSGVAANYLSRVASESKCSMFVEDVNDGTIGVARWAGIRVPRTNSQVIADTHMRIIAKANGA